MEIVVKASNRYWSVDINNRKEIGQLFLNNPDIDRVYIASDEDEPEVLTDWDVFQAYHDGECWLLTSRLKTEFST